MKKIVLFGAGKSATVLIDYLLAEAEKHRWKLLVADANLQLAQQKIRGSVAGEAISIDVTNDTERRSLVEQASIVISMLPPFLHHLVADDCIICSRHLLTASYIDDELRKKQQAIEKSGVLFLCETGLDPGIDHMSAMQLIDDIHSRQGVIFSFKSHCGGLVAPESDNNPWHYKISWNPRNIIMAGKAGAVYLQNGSKVHCEYRDLFHQPSRIIVDGLDDFGWYANRDSLSYIGLYHLPAVKDFIRTTLRHPSFMEGWKEVVDLGLTNEEIKYPVNGRPVSSLYRDMVDEKKIAALPANVQEQLSYLFYESDDLSIPFDTVTAADLLQFVAEKKLALLPDDKDMIVMQHELEYELKGLLYKMTSTLVVKGENQLYTAMAKTVGLPLGIAACLVLKGEITLTGLHIPTAKEIYQPVLKALKENGIVFHDKKSKVSP